VKKESYIAKRINNFFAAENFRTPAIKTIEKMDFDYSRISKKIWSEIKSNPTSIGFYYLQGEEMRQAIVYVKSLKKVIVYLSCC
jgi:hypothetical protein